VVAGLTIVLAYIAAGMPEQEVPHFARFEDWCKYVRNALIWLGMDDPCKGRGRIEGRDPVREQLIALLTAWYEVFGSEPVKVGDVIKEAGDLDGSTAKIEARRVLYEALAELGGRNGKMSPTAIGKFIASHEDRIEAGLRFEKAGKAKGAVLWRVRAMDSDNQAPAMPNDPLATPPSSSGEVGEVGEVPKAQEKPFIIKGGKLIIKKKLAVQPVEHEDPVQGSGDPPPQPPCANPDNAVNGPKQLSASGDAGDPVNEPDESATQGDPVDQHPEEI
jgi:hypothetical protein